MELCDPLLRCLYPSVCQNLSEVGRFIAAPFLRWEGRWEKGSRAMTLIKKEHEHNFLPEEE